MEDTPTTEGGASGPSKNSQKATLPAPDITCLGARLPPWLFGMEMDASSHVPHAASLCH